MSDGHLVHGMGTALKPPTWPAIAAAEAETILGRFPAAGRLIDIIWHSPRPFSAAALIEAEQGTYFLKRHHQKVRSASGLVQEHLYIAHLRAAGLSVTDVMAMSDGASAIALGEWTYELHRRAPGIDLYRDRQSWTAFLTLGHAYEAGIALALLHQASNGFSAPARTDQPLVASFTILPAHDPFSAVHAYVAARPALAAWLGGMPWREEIARLFVLLGGGLAERLRAQPPLWTHNDWHPSNLLWSAEGKVSTVIDFGLATRTNALHDLATALERTAFRWLTLRQGNAVGDLDSALALLAGYRSIIALTKADLSTLIRLLPLVHVEFALSEIAYFIDIVGDRDQAAVAWEDYLVGHADWFLSVSGQDFLHHFADAAIS